jgi:uncharacterized membrane protein YgdD (TMEM256/DUF423 family)
MQNMQRICQIVGWGLISLLLISGGTMSYLIITNNPFWTDFPLRQKFIPLGHAHAGVLGIIMLLFGLYLDKVNLSEQLKKWTAIIYIAGALLMPGGFLLSVLSNNATEPGREFLLTPIGGVLVGISFITMFIGMIRTKKTSV